MAKTEIIPIYNSHSISLETQGITLFRGLDDETANAAVSGALQPHIATEFPSDTLRFPSFNEAKRFFEGKPVYSAIAHRAIGALAWYDNTSFSMRMYEDMAEKGFDDRFIEAVHEDFRLTTDYEGPIHVSTSRHDTRAIDFFGVHGYVEEHGEGGDEEFGMVRND